MRIEGPLAGESKPSSTEFFPSQPITDDQAETLIERFAKRAWRYSHADEGFPSPRSAIELFRGERSEGVTRLDALHLSFQAILCSPRFLYHRSTNGPMSQRELAGRLSFFLWGMPPDEELLSVAALGRLAEPEELRRQTERLLRDPRRKSFVQAFTDSWLHLKKLGTMLPDRVEHPAYYNERLEDAMLAETRMYFDDALQHDRPVSVFIDSDYTFLNSSLARHYGIEGVTGHRFRRVELDDRNRGGLLGHASVLTASANGIDTSPVVRGMWVMECLLGTPPPSPPPDVEPIEPDIRGTVTIREQLAAHREIATCANCHRRIDPPGFALESFDEIGRFRTHYDTGGWRRKRLAKIDPSGILASGERFRDIRELKLQLKAKTNLVAANLASKLLRQATGRFEDPRDKAELLEMSLANATDPGVRELIHTIVQSESFRR
ncbi:MAG: DUF1592 domain-containing protein [Planctomycetota bacterium]